MRIISLKTMGKPKIAVLAIGLTTAVLVATINPAVNAQATPSRGATCVECHSSGATVKATPSSTTLAPAARASMAADRPAAPPPTTITSNCSSRRFMRLRKVNWFCRRAAPKARCGPLGGQGATRSERPWGPHA